MSQSNCQSVAVAMCLSVCSFTHLSVFTACLPLPLHILRNCKITVNVILICFVWLFRRIFKPAGLPTIKSHKQHNSLSTNTVSRLADVSNSSMSLKAYRKSHHCTVVWHKVRKDFIILHGNSLLCLHPSQWNEHGGYIFLHSSDGCLNMTCFSPCVIRMNLAPVLFVFICFKKPMYQLLAVSYS